MTSPTALHSIYRWFAGSLPAFLEPGAKRHMADLPLHLLDDVSSERSEIYVAHNDNRPAGLRRNWQVK